MKLLWHKLFNWHKTFYTGSLGNWSHFECECGRHFSVWTPGA